MEDLITFQEWKKGGFLDKIIVTNQNLEEELELAIMKALIDSNLVVKTGGLRVYKHKYLASLYYVRITLEIEFNMNSNKRIFDIGIDLSSKKIHTKLNLNCSDNRFATNLIFHFIQLIPVFQKIAI